MGLFGGGSKMPPVPPIPPAPPPPPQISSSAVQGAAGNQAAAAASAAGKGFGDTILTGPEGLIQTGQMLDKAKPQLLGKGA